MVEWKKLGEICEIGTGANNREDACDDGLYPFFVRSQEVLRINEYLFNEEAILIPGEGGVGDIFHYFNGKYGLHQRTYRVHPISDSVYGKYIYYYLFANFKCYINKKSYKSTAASIRKPMLTDFPISIPSLSEQSRIVSILDTFTSSISNLKQQIEERRKQYNFLLDKLYYANKSELLEATERGEVCVKTLDEIGTFTRGRRFVRTDIVEEGVPCIHYGDMYTYYGVCAEKTPTFLTKEKAEKLRFAKKGDVVIVAAGENDIDIGVGVAWLGEEDVVVHDACFIFKHNMNPKYLSYFMRSMNYHLQIRMGVVDGKICSISAKELGRTLAPVPSLQAQSRIVSILDTFEQSISNLEEQLAMREKQYEYYRNQLLTFEGEEERGKT